MKWKNKTNQKQGFTRLYPFEKIRYEIIFDAIRR